MKGLETYSIFLKKKEISYLYFKKSVAKCFLCNHSVGIINGKNTKSVLVASGLVPPEGMTDNDAICGKCRISLYGNESEISSMKVLGTSARETVSYPLAYTKVADAISNSLEELEWKIKFGNSKDGHVEAKPSNTWKTFSGYIVIGIKQEINGVVVTIESISPTKMDMGQSRDYLSKFIIKLNEHLGIGKECMLCNIPNPKLRVENEWLCEKCFENKYGKHVLQANPAQYFGGHKAFLAGGLIDTAETGELVLTEKYLIFQKLSSRIQDLWAIKIPLSLVQIEKWTVKEEARRTTMVGGGVVPFSDMPVVVGGGTMNQQGKRHELVVPYIDENGIPQEPRFGISSLGGKAIRDWSEKLYEQIVKVRKTSPPSVIETPTIQQTNGSNQKDNDPLHVLKMRLAKGEITKDEYEDLKKTIE